MALDLGGGLVGTFLSVAAGVLGLGGSRAPVGGGLLASRAAAAPNPMMSIFGGGQGGVLNLGMDIFGGGRQNPWGFAQSPMLGNILGAVGSELLKPTMDDRVEEARKMMEAKDEVRRKSIRKNYGTGLYSPKRRRKPGNMETSYAG